MFELLKRTRDMQDDHLAVRHAAFEALASMIPALDSSAHARILPPLRSQLANVRDAGAPTQRVLARLMASLPLALCPMAPNDRAAIFTAFHQLAAVSDAETRLHCARSFPAVVMALLTDANASLDGPFLATYYALATESRVRSHEPFLLF